ncbi:MAG: hypothetical protein P1V97_01880 [Planctomycetota bacterium]|nr:hypothetical protein [Planctomycetota bacterium]
MTRLFTKFHWGLLFAPALLLVPSQVFAEKIYTPTELKKELPKLINKKIRVDAKFYEIWGEPQSRYVKVLLEPELKFYLPNQTVAIRKSLDKGLDVKGQKLTEKSSNVIITAKIYPPRNGPSPFLFLISIEKTDDDETRFSKQLTTVINADAKNITARLNVTFRARNWARVYNNKSLKDWAVDQDRGTLELNATLLKSKDSKGWIELADKYDSILQDRPGAISLLDGAYEKEKDKAFRDALSKKLESIEAYYYNGQWVGFRDYKAMEGFIERLQGRKKIWIKKERAEFEDVINKDRKRSFPFIIKADQTYMADALKGRISKGMRPFQLVKLKWNGKELGFPDHVDRSRINVGVNTRIYDQWIFNNGQRFYFVDGHLFSWPDAKTPYPKK